ncbi:MAG: PfkB family carbohydrate kinase [Minisyncoccia bacterium]
MSLFSKPLDFIAIGDITTDAFIRLKDARVTCDVNDENCTISMRYGDKIPYEFVKIVRAVGNSSNAAISASRLGLNSALIANMGGDENGKMCLAVLKEEKVETKFVNIQKDKETNYHYVLWFEKDRTILVKHQPFAYKLPNIDSPKWIYLSSMGENTEKYHDEIAEFLNKSPNTKLAFQPGTFQMSLGTERLKAIYARSEIFFCNREEAQRILNKVSDTDIKELLLGLHMLGPQMVVITLGPKGAYGADKTGIYFAPPFNPEEPAYERTGAGDAFASACTSALALGKTLPEALSWGAVNGMSVCRYIGAREGLLTTAQIQEELTKRADYKIEKIS